MASTVTHRGTTFNTTAGNKTVTATPAANDLIVVITAATGVTTSSVTDNQGGTYVQVDSTRTGFSTTGNLQAWVRTALIPAGSSTIFTANQASSTGGGLSVLSVSGMSLTGASAVRSSGGQSTGTSGTTPAPVLSLTPLSSNPIITAVASANTVAGSVLVQRTGYTEDFDNIYSTPATAMEVAHLASGETSATLTAGGTSTTQFASIAIELQFNSAPTTALNTPADTATGISTTPTLNFTGTDSDSDAVEYEVEVDTVNTFDSQVTTIDSYSESNQDASSAMGTGTIIYLGQSFTGSGVNMTKIKFYLEKAGSPTGTLTAKLYNHTGTFGTTGTPTGAALATSTNSVDVATDITTSFNLISFNFDPILLSNGTHYFIVLFFNSTSSDATTNRMQVGRDGSSPSHSGNVATSTDGSAWSSNSALDLCFYVLSITPLIDKLSTTDVGFTAGHPFASGAAKDFTVQAGDTLTGSTTYYWRVRAIDPSGADTYGTWSGVRSFTTAPAAISPVGKDIQPMQNTLGANVLQAVNRSGSY